MATRTPPIKTITGIILCWLGLAIFQISNIHAAAYMPPTDPATAAENIRNYFENRTAELNAEKKGHWALRLYRSSGDTQYSARLDDYKHYMLQCMKKMLQTPENLIGKKNVSENKPIVSAKEIKRQAILADWQVTLHYRRLLYYTYQITMMGGVTEPESSQILRPALDVLTKIDFRPFLFNPDVILYNSAKAINSIYYLKRLGISDFEEEFLKICRNLFDSVPSTPSVEFNNKVYGLTHLIIADSDFYLHPVSYEKHRWIFDFFENHASEIFDLDSPDIISEIAICFKLADRPDHPLVSRVQSYLLKKIDQKEKILFRKEPASIDLLEHRNIVAYLALLNRPIYLSGQESKKP